jgi:hypothetical protein
MKGVGTIIAKQRQTRNKRKTKRIDQRCGDWAVVAANGKDDEWGEWGGSVARGREGGGMGYLVMQCCRCFGLTMVVLLLGGGFKKGEQLLWRKERSTW